MCRDPSIHAALHWVHETHPLWHSALDAIQHLSLPTVGETKLFPSTLFAPQIFQIHRQVVNDKDFIFKV